MKKGAYFRISDSSFFDRPSTMTCQDRFNIASEKKQLKLSNNDFKVFTEPQFGVTSFLNVIFFSWIDI